MIVRVLKNANFHVLSAKNGANALKLAAEMDGRIHLVLSDLNMPQMSGPDLGQLLMKTRPDMHLMLMSAGVNGTLLFLNYSWAFVQKPLIPKKLVQMVTDVLHAPDWSQVGRQGFDSRLDGPWQVIAHFFQEVTTLVCGLFVMDYAHIQPQLSLEDCRR